MHPYGGYYYETARVKHIDAILLTELEEGLDQVAILGAGYDSRPYRFADVLTGVRVYEVDLPAISAVKRRKTARILNGLPPQVDYIEADLVCDALQDRLSQRSYRPEAATLLILSGVAPYLPAEAVERLFRFVGSHGSLRTSIVFDYVYREMVDGDDAFHGAAQTRRRLDASVQRRPLTDEREFLHRSPPATHGGISQLCARSAGSVPISRKVCKPGRGRRIGR